MPLDVDHDRALMTSAQEDPAAFGPIVTCYYDPIFRYCALRAVTARDAEAEAVAVFTEAFAALPQYQWDGRPLLAWLFAFARRRSSARAHHDAMSEHDAATPNPSDSAGSELSEACTEARRLLGRMDPPTAETLVLHAVAGCSFEEIAALQGVPPATVKLRVYRAIARARRAMGSDDEG